MKNSKILIIALLTMLLVPATLSARTTHIRDTYPSLGWSARALGMGNAFLTTKGPDEASFFYNPASINDYSTDFDFRVMGLNADFNYKMLSTLTDALDLNDDLKGATDAGKITVFQNFINKHSGQFNQVNLFVPFVTMMNKYITVSVLADTMATISFRNRAFPNFEVFGRGDGGMVLGSSYSFFYDDLQVGVALKVLYRAMIDKIITTNDIIANNDLTDELGWKQWKKGFGVGGDIGVKYSLKDLGPEFLYILDPVVAVVYQDIANTRFTGGAESTPQSVNTALGVHPTFGDYKTSFEAAFTQMNTKMDFLTKFHFGAELWFPKVIATKFAVRAGCNEGYPAGGFTADWNYAKLEFAFYGEEMGQYTHQKANWHLATNLSFGF